MAIERSTDLVLKKESKSFLCIPSMRDVADNSAFGKGFGRGLENVTPALWFADKDWACTLILAILAVPKGNLGFVAFTVVISSSFS